MITKDMKEKLEAFARLLNIMDELREKCPWDKKQTMESLRHLTIEETYELADAILKNEKQEVKKELGDILLHIVFYARIASETKEFDIADVINSLCEKLIVRHPHIYGNVEALTEEQVKENWEKIKLKEGAKSVLAGVPVSLPALIKASRIQDKAKAVGFEWENKDQVWQKVEEEIQEFKAELNSGDKAKAEEEFGDLLFSLVNYARFIDINAEDALERTNLKFIKRFNYIEEQAKNTNQKLEEMTLEEMDNLWNEAKLI
ncbi:MAG: nucleoside triphosphate pyrophosphohydrolase [Bacteroidetes bacterium]|nr:nucleoside triphosphate pyrophosphohydrolase [Bacteroidota bacterium]HET6245973.1 nucleoside triphosphate pyrophosphohydrolase [Bacteroidia bacterium]